VSRTSKILSHVLLLSGSNIVEKYLGHRPVISTVCFCRDGRDTQFFTVLLNARTHYHRHFELWISA
jgi:hypothetical protein